MKNEDMNKMPLVSVIIPIYNAEKYLEYCLDSIVGQTYQNLEIILVNDGSTDRSEEICRRYMRKDARIRLYTQENQGLSVARNTGLDHMRGEYVTFVDSDDYLSLSFVETLLSAAEEKKASIVVCDYDTPREGDQKVEAGGFSGPFPCRSMSVDGVYDALDKRHFDMRFGSAWGKLYAKRIFNAVRFEPGKIYEDVFIFPKIYCQVEEICCVDLNLYHYVQSRNSIIRTNGVSGRAHPDYIEGSFKLLEYFRAYGKEKYTRMAASRVVMGTINWFDSQDLPPSDVRRHIREAEDKIFSITGRRYLTLRLAVYMVSPGCYRFIRGSWKKIKAGKYR